MHVRKKEKIQNFFQTDEELKRVFGSRLRDAIFTLGLACITSKTGAWN